MTSYSVADQLITREPNREILVNQLAIYEAVKALVTKFGSEAWGYSIQQNFILLPTDVLNEMSPLEVLCRLLSSLQLVL